MGLDPKWHNIKSIAQDDINSLIESEKSYGDSWKRRGGTGAFMMLARKFVVEDEIRSNNITGRIEHWESEKESTTGSD